VNQAASQFVILGSSDNLNWNLLSSVTSTSWTNSLPNNIIVNSEQYYRYYGFVFTHANSSTNISLGELELYGTPLTANVATGTDVVLHTTPNVPKTDFSNVYYDGQDYTSMPATVADKSGNGVTGTPSGGVGFDTTYKAFTFDGVDDAIETGATSFTGNAIFTATLWGKFDRVTDPTSANAIFTIGYDGTQTQSGLRVDESTGKFRFYTNSGTGSLTTVVSAVTNTWYHLILVHGGSSGYKLYINGEKVGETVTDNLNLASNQR